MELSQQQKGNKKMKVTKLLLTVFMILSCIILATSCDTLAKLGLIEHTHEYSESWTHDEENHWKHCTKDGCDGQSTKAAHSWGNPDTTEAQVGKEGKKVFTCTVCAATKTEIIPALEHLHVAGDEWLSNGEHHWNLCTEDGCGAKINTSIHIWDNGTVINEAASGKEGLIRYLCVVCMNSKNETLPALPEKMSEEEWCSYFEIDNVRIDAIVDVGGFGSSSMFTLIDGEYASVTTEGETYYSTSESELSQIDFSDAYDAFNHLGDGVYYAKSVTLSEEETDIELTDITIVFADGRINGVSYNMDLLGISTEFSFTFSEWGEVTVEVPTLDDDTYSAILNPENYYNYSLDVSQFDADYNGYSATYIFNGDDFSISFNDGGETQFGTLENAGIDLNPILAILSMLSAEDFTFDSYMNEFICTSESLENYGFISLCIVIDNGYLVGAYCYDTEGWEYYYDFYGYGESTVGETDDEAPILDSETYAAILDTSNYYNYTLDVIECDSNGNFFGGTYVFNADKYSFLSYEEGSETEYDIIEDAGVTLNPLLTVFDTLSAEDFAYYEYSGAFASDSELLYLFNLEYIEIIIEDGYLVSAYVETIEYTAIYYTFYDYGTSIFE